MYTGAASRYWRQPVANASTRTSRYGALVVKGMEGAARPILLALVVGALVAGCDGGDNASDPGSVTAHAVAFRADAGTEGERLLKFGGLTLKGYCRRQAGQMHLAVTATTATDDAVLGSRFSQRSSPYSFVLEDFDPRFGEYDVLGKASDETAGTLTYMSSDGGQVAVDYVAAEDTAQADCVFGGVATYASSGRAG